MKFEQETFLKPGTYGQKNPRTLSRDELAAMCENTNAMIRSGVAVPVFDEHPKAGTNGSGPQKDSSRKTRKSIDAVGWIHSVSANSNGELSWELDVQDSKYAHAIRTKRIKRTSPEIGSFREHWTDGDGKDWGRVIRHAAFTAFPKNAHQTDLIALSDGDEGEEYIQLSLDSLQMSYDENNADSNKDNPGGSGGDNPGSGEDPNREIANPNMPKDMEREQKKVALVAQLAELGIVLPADFDLDDPWSIDILLGSVMTATNAKQEIEAATRQNEVQADVVAEPQPITQLSEEDEMANTKLLNFATKMQRENIGIKLSQATLPDGIRSALKDRLETVQFSEDESDEAVGFSETPVFTMSEVIDMVSGSIPKQVADSGLVTSEVESEVVAVAEPGDGAPSDQPPEKTDAEKAATETPEEAKAWAEDFTKKAGGFVSTA
jgi:hypothetical protein